MSHFKIKLIIQLMISYSVLPSYYSVITKIDFQSLFYKGRAGVYHIDKIVKDFSKGDRIRQTITLGSKAV